MIEGNPGGDEWARERFIELQECKVGRHCWGVWVLEWPVWELMSPLDLPLSQLSAPNDLSIEGARDRRCVVCGAVEVETRKGTETTRAIIHPQKSAAECVNPIPSSYP